MKTIYATLLVIFLASCQTKEGKESEEVLKMSKQKLEFVRKHGDDAQAKMILKYGESKVRWFDSITDARNAEYDAAQGSAKAKEQRQIDSVNNTLKGGK